MLQIFAKQSSRGSGEGKLILVSQYQLAGTITGLGRVHLETTKCGGDAVLISFRDAKLSLIEWDAVQYTISTISIHYYENHIDQSAPWLPDSRECTSHLTIDPNSRCAAFNFGVSSLAIVPFHQKTDDLALDDDMDDFDEEQPEKSTIDTNGAVNNHKTPYFPSFVLPMTLLDPVLLHPIHLTFLHEYRDPTIGILYSTAARSSNMSSERKDVTIYSVYALDIEQRASTNLQTVQNLPNDIHTVKGLPLPVSGTLLIGGNELIHIDQGGRATGISVNELARDASSFPLTDQAHHQMRLEGCQVAQIDPTSGDLLLVLRSSELAILSFRLDGRSVAGISLKRVNDDKLRRAIRGSSTCMSAFASGEVFVGSDESDSVLVTNSARPALLWRQSSRVRTAIKEEDKNGNGFDDSMDGVEDDNDNDDDDDIFATSNGQNVDDGAPSAVNISVLDILPTIAPIHQSAFGRVGKRKREDDDDAESQSRSREGLELAVSYGNRKAGGIAFFSQKIYPSVKRRLAHGKATSVWACCSSDAGEQRFIVSENTQSDGLASSLWSINGGRHYKIYDTAFEAVKGQPIAVGTFETTRHTIYVTGSEIRVYDSSFGISQILPIVDEDEDQLARAVHADFAEPYMTVLKDDQTLMLLKADKNGELEELDLPDPSMTLASASLYIDSSDFFQASRYQATSADPPVLLTLLETSGTLSILPLSNLKVQIFHFARMRYLTPVLGQGAKIEKHWRNADELAVAMLGDIGDAVHRQPHLVIRNTTGDVILYEPFALPEVVGTYKFRKVLTRNAEYNNDDLTFEEDGEAPQTLPPMQKMASSGLSAIFVPGETALLITKTSANPAQIYPVGNKGDVVSLCATREHDADLISVDDKGDLYQAFIPSDLLLGIAPWVAQRRALGNEVTSLAYYEGSSCYVVATHIPTPFHLPLEDEWHPEWADEQAQFLPTSSTSKIQLISSATHNVISEHTFDEDERVLDVQTMQLETSEITHRQQELVVVGTGTIRGEGIVARGHIYLFSVAEVVPRPGIPESDLKLKLLSVEEVRGAVTALTPIGSQGFVLAAQGQKCMVRGLREDLSILPVAFMDMRFHTSVSKTLPSTGFCILGDAFSGLWLVGYSEEPYKLQLLSRDLEDPSVTAADFLPSEDNKELFIISADGDGELRILQYDPENPKSDRGQKLLLRSTFHTGDLPTTMRLIPRTPTSYESALSAPTASTNNGSSSPSASPDAMAVDTPDSKPKTQLLLTHQSGAIALLTPLSEPTYRRLAALQNILMSSAIEQPCGLNPRAYRRAETDGMGGRAVIDGNVVRRWMELNSHHKANVADKSGARAVWEVRGDLEGVLGGGVGFMA